MRAGPGRCAEARDFLRQSTRLSDELEYNEGLIYCLVALAALSAATGDAEPAATFIGAADAAAKAAGYALESLERGVHDRTLETVKNELGDHAFTAAYAIGRQFGWDDSVAYALGQPASRVTAPA